MKKFIYSIIQGLVVFTILYIILIIIGGTFMPKYMLKNIQYNRGGGGSGNLIRLEEAKKIKNIDVLFLGSSHAYRSFDPRIFAKENITSFNLGSSAQTHIQTEILLKRYLENINPKLIVYDVYLGIFLIDGIESSLDLISNDLNDFLSFKMVLKSKNIKLYNTYIYANYRSFFQLDKNYNHPKINGEDTYVKGGYVEKKMKRYKMKPENKTKWNIKKEQFSAFKRNIEYIKSKNIKLLLIQTPITKTLYNSRINSDKFDSIMKSYNNDYCNFTKIMKLNDTLDFYDSNHLNMIGVQKFNKKIIEIINKKLKTN